MLALYQLLAQRVSQSGGSLATLGMLGFIGFLGHHTEWSIVGAHGHGHSGHAPPAAAAPLPLDAPAPEEPMVVRFLSPDAVRKSGVTTLSAQSRRLAEYVDASGVIGYDKRRVARLSSRVAGTVFRIEKYLGDPVRAGDVLLVVEAIEVGRQKAEFLLALAQTEMNEESLRRLELSRDAVPERQIRQARAELRASRVRLLNAEQALVNLGIDTDMEHYQGLTEFEQSNLLHFAGLPKSIVESLDRATTTSNLVAIVAPFDGMLTHGDVGLGEVVEPGKQLLHVADISRMWLCLEVRKEAISKLRIGQPITFRADGIATELKSDIAWISTEADEATRTLQVRAQIENPIAHLDDPSANGQRLLRANTFGVGRILVSEKSSAVVVPRDCIQSDGTHDLVFVQRSPTEFEGRIIERGIEEGDFVEIIGPVSIGDSVAQQGSHLLKSQLLLARTPTNTP